MTTPNRTILAFVLAMAVMAIATPGLGQRPPRNGQDAGTDQGPLGTAPDLADIVPQAARLAGRVMALEDEINAGLDAPDLASQCVRLEAAIHYADRQLQRLESSKNYKYSELVELREVLSQESRGLKRISDPIGQLLRQLEVARDEWSAEKQRWADWQSHVIEHGALDELAPTFKAATKDVHKAISFVTLKLETLLELQERVSRIQAKADTLLIALERLTAETRHSVLLDVSPPMFSPRFFAQFRGELGSVFRTQRHEISWSERRFLERAGWIIVLHGLLSLLTLLGIRKVRRALHQAKQWRFLSARPFSAALFFGYMATVLIYEYVGAPASWKLCNLIVGAVAYTRLAAVLLETSWKRKFVYGLMTVLIATRIVDALNFAVPVVRLYTVVMALVALVFCLRLAKQSRQHEDGRLYPWALRLASVFFAAIIVAELWGKAAVAQHLFVSLLDSAATALVFALFMYMLRGVLERLVSISPLKRAAELQGRDIDRFIRDLARFINVAIWALALLPAILMIWGLYDTLAEATSAFLAVGFTLGSQRFTVGLGLAAGGILFGSLLVSWVVQTLLLDEALGRRRMERGVRHSMARLVHYGIVFVAFLMALAALGFEISKITIVLSALGVGIGFGLQGVVNNFVSGIILLFERPVRVGDTIEIGGQWAEIKSIGLRATAVRTFDQADVIIPNADLVTNQVTNWTLSNRQVRLIIPVGVAYGSDIPLVVKTLAACARDHDRVTSTMSPQVLFLSFGESSLDFELRVWIKDVDFRLTVRSDLHQAIDQKFREANIEIAFPQRDLHVRSVDTPALPQPKQGASD